MRALSPQKAKKSEKKGVGTLTMRVQSRRWLPLQAEHQRPVRASKEEVPWLLCEVTHFETSIVSSSSSGTVNRVARGQWQCRWTRTARDDSFLLQLDLPGVASESIELSVEDNVLTISAERPAPPSGEGVESVIAERTFGTFSRQIVLGKTLDAERIEANYEGGVLTVAIPVAEQAKPRRIEVRVGSDHKELSTSAA